MNKGRVLVVEDDKIIALEIKERLADFGYDVIAMVKTGYLAIEQAIINKPDLILMDISLEGEIDGIVTAERIRKVIDIPIIYLTALVDEETIDRAKFTTPYGYIVKPLEDRDLRSAVEIALFKHKSERTLRDSEAKYRAIVNSIEAQLYLVNEDRRVVFSNRPSDQNFDTENKVVRCYKAIFNRNMVCENCCMDSVKNGEINRCEMYDEKNKSWFSVISSPLKLSDGSFYNQHLVINISEQKRSEMDLKSQVEEKNLQLREVNHRVKNNMQMLLSLLRLQLANNISADAAYNLKTFEQRIKSMLLIQEDLNRSAVVSKVPFHSYAAKLADNLSKAYNINTEKIKMNIDLGELHIPAELAISCGLIINELLTNSIKHAFPDNTEGVITLKLKGDDRGFEFMIKDNGVGLPKISNKGESTGIGLQLVNTLVSQLGGEIAILNKVGMEYRINVKTSEHITA